jgi:arginine/ornithine N-succinyltransferase beta subunit
MESRSFILAACLVGLSAAAAPPEIGQVMDPTRGGETILLSGEGFDEKTLFRMWVPTPAFSSRENKLLTVSSAEKIRLGNL